MTVEKRAGLLIAGLRRSGTTALWQAFRTAPGLVAFDEPFHPRLWTGARESTKGTWAELTALWQDGPTDLVSGVTPLEPHDELTPDLTEAQQEYLLALLSDERPVVIDVVRHWNKLGALATAAPGLHIVLLVRSPVPWVMSHLMPSGGSGWRFALGTRIRRATALYRRSNFDNWQYETIFDAAVSMGHPLLDYIELSAEDLAREPAYVKLLAFWWAANLRSYRDLELHAPDRYDLVLSENFMTDPYSLVHYLNERAGLGTQQLDLSSIRPPRCGPLLKAPAWTRAFERLGIPRTLLPTAIPDAAVLEAAFAEGPK